MSTSDPRLGRVSFTTNCCERQLSHQTAMPSTITVLPANPSSEKRSPVRTSVSAMRRTGDEADDAGDAALVGVAEAVTDVAASSVRGGALAAGVVAAPQATQATTNASARPGAIRT